MAPRRRVAPPLSIVQSNVEVVDTFGSADRAASTAELSEDHTDRSLLRHRLRGDVLTFWRRVLQYSGKRNPQLEQAQRLSLEGTAVVPDTVARLHPFQAAGEYLAGLPGRVLVM